MTDAPGAPSRRVICILGSPRTGTHLVNSVLCGSDRVLPMLSETAPANSIVGGYRLMLGHFERFPGIHFDREEEVRVMFGGLLGSFVDHLCQKYGREVCVFRSPMLTRQVGRLRELLDAAGAQRSIVCMVRDPRDVVASMRRWAVERRRRGGPPLVEGDDELLAMITWMLVSYHALIGPGFDGAPGDDVLFVRFEDLVREPEPTAAQIGEFVGLELGDPRSGIGWREAQIDFTPGDERIGEAVTEHYGRPLSPAPLGSWTGELSDAEAEVVLRRARMMVRRFYPELLESP